MSCRDNTLRLRGGLSLALITALLSLSFSNAQAARKCRITVGSLAFGVYTPATPSPVDSVGNISVRCNGRPKPAQPSFYVLRIDGGSGGIPSNRNMLSGVVPLFYNLFKDVARTDIWGDGTAATTPVIQVLPAGRMGNKFTMVHSVYGRISAGQDPAPGLYGDIPIVTIEF